jgi:hypothetical protein
VERSVLVQVQFWAPNKKSQTYGLAFLFGATAASMKHAGGMFQFEVKH